MKKLLKKSLIAGLVLGAVPVVSNAQTYGVTIQTTTDAAGSALATRLFLDGGFTTSAPVGSRLWFVADTAGNGVPMTDAGAPGLVLGPDDSIIYTDVVDGAIFGNNDGRYSRTTGVSIDNTYQNSPIFAFLWGNGNPTSEAEVQGGNTFGVFNVGVRPPPAIGNANWYIFDNVNGSQFSVVPEPSPLLLGIGGFCLLLAVQRFRRARV